MFQILDGFMKTEANTYKESNSWGGILVAVLNARTFCDLILKARITDHAVVLVLPAQVRGSIPE